MRVFIEDRFHCDRIAECDSFDAAIERLKQIAQLSWDQTPNRAPCRSWRTCGREYQVIEFDDSAAPWKVVRAVPVLRVSASSIEWSEGFENAE